MYMYASYSREQRGKKIRSDFFSGKEKVKNGNTDFLVHNQMNENLSSSNGLEGI